MPGNTAPGFTSTYASAGRLHVHLRRTAPPAACRLNDGLADTSRRTWLSGDQRGSGARAQAQAQAQDQEAEGVTRPFGAEPHNQQVGANADRNQSSSVQGCSESSQVKVQVGGPGQVRRPTSRSAR